MTVSCVLDRKELRGESVEVRDLQERQLARERKRQKKGKGAGRASITPLRAEGMLWEVGQSQHGGVCGVGNLKVRRGKHLLDVAYTASL